ncbi:MAG: universal stress protein [Chloroflexi bacterium]|nr:universal stress protein [Chloroflexota bacterium]
MFKKILVPLDGSEHARKIVGWATGLAGALKAEIILLSVIDPEEIEILEATTRGLRDDVESRSASGTGVRTRVRAPAEVIEDALEQAEKDLRVEAQKIRAAGVKATVSVGAGSPAEVIVSDAHRLGADLIAMATRRESALARGVLGSVTDRVLHSTSTPILTMYPGEIHESGDYGASSQPPTHVIVPLDGSTLSESAVRPAMEIAKAAGADIVFTETVRLPFFGVGVAGIEYGAGDFAGDYTVDTQKEEVTEYLEEFITAAKAEGVAARLSVRVGSPSQQIVEEAAEVEGSIIVMGSHGSGGLKRWVVGSVADKVIRSARRPVLVIPPKTG